MDEVLGAEFAGVLVSDFYAAYHHYDGPKQRCWAHLLRGSHDLQSLYPEDEPLSQWSAAVHQLYRQVAGPYPPRSATTPPSAACAIWWSAARSAGALARIKALTPR